MNKRITLLSLAALGTPIVSSAHEVYVLPLDVIHTAMTNPSPDPFGAYSGNEFSFFFWAVVALVMISTVAAATFFRLFEARSLPYLMSLKKYALPVARLTAGISTLSFGLAAALYGTEMPFSSLFGSASTFMQGFFILAGAAITLGVFTRPFAILLSLVYVYAGYIYGWYVLTYTDHIGLYILLILLGGGGFSVSRRFRINEMQMPNFVERLRPIAFPVMRACLGFGVLFASVYAKYLYSSLALNVVTMYHLTRYFPFDPLFVVLGALIVEFLIGLLIFFGVAIRWTLIFLAIWLTLSLLYFQELIWPHIILFGLAISLFCHGYDRYSLEGFFLKKGRSEPLL